MGRFPISTYTIDVPSLNQQFISELLELYRSLPSIWKLNSPLYKNKLAKERAYKLLVRKCREYIPKADREYVKAKINTLRTSFRKEYRKVQASKTEATDKSEIYVPNLWYYNLLLFTVKDDDNDTVEVKTEEMSADSEEDIKNDVYLSNLNQIIVPLTKERDPLSPPMKKLKTTPVTSSNVPEDVFDAIGKNVAHKLRGMNPQQRMYAEKIISDIMYHGQMETLTPKAHLSLDT